MGDVKNNLAFEKFVLLLAQNEESHGTISYRLDVNKSTVSRALRRQRDTERHHQDRLINIGERFVSAPLLQNCMLDKYALHLSENTVRRQLKEDQIRPRRPATRSRIQINCSPPEGSLKLCTRTYQLGPTRLVQSFVLR
jgi:hypothetical protein